MISGWISHIKTILCWHWGYYR